MLLTFFDVRVHFWLMVGLLLTRTPRSFSAELLPSQQAPTLRHLWISLQQYVWSYPCKNCLMTNSSITWGVQYTLLWIFCWSKASLQEKKNKKNKTVAAEDTSNQCCIRFPWVQSILKPVLAGQKVSMLLLVQYEECGQVIKDLEKKPTTAPSLQTGCLQWDEDSLWQERT